jgi:hypothetical protein
MDLGGHAAKKGLDTIHHTPNDVKTARPDQVAKLCLIGTTIVCHSLIT